ncbi:nitroreductase family protein [Oerskovia flava]|uniref:nitroreductase family protein n=1 Tax=Oerskovia flava TaxID=2986422 RepID=UPI002240ADB6|nr:nitroreductase family protein [Oerskovia sp. JB1-3-2]
MTLTSTPSTASVGRERSRRRLAERYGSAQNLDVAAHNDVLDVQLRHRTVRSYLPDALEPSIVPTLVAAAQSAPSSSNLQLWSVVAVEDAGRRDRIAALAGGQEHIRTAPLLLVWVADLARARAIGSAADVHLEGSEFLESTLVAVIDAALAAQNALVAAESLGLGTVYIGAVRNHPQQIAAELGLPPGVVAVVGLVVGHADPAGGERVKPRLPQEAVLHRERYDLDSQDAHVATYEQLIEPFYRSEGLPGGWRERVIDRLRVPGSLKGRAHLRSALEALGLPSK